MTPSFVSLHPGESADVAVTIDRDGFVGAVEVRPIDISAAMTVTSASIPSSSTSTILHASVRADAAADPGGSLGYIVTDSVGGRSYGSLTTRAMPWEDESTLADGTRLVLMTNELFSPSIRGQRIYSFESDDGTYERPLLTARTVSDAQRDPTFGDSGRVRMGFSGFGLAVDDLGRLIAMTDVRPTTSTADTFVASRWSSEGVPDTSFGAGGEVRIAGLRWVGCASPGSDGDMALCSMDSGLPFVHRLNPDGKLDAMFGAVQLPESHAVLAAAGGVLIASPFEVDLLDGAGNLDPSFGADGRVSLAWPSSLYEGADGSRYWSVVDLFSYDESGNLLLAVSWERGGTTFATISADGSSVRMWRSPSGDLIRTPYPAMAPIPDDRGGYYLVTAWIDDPEDWSTVLVDHVAADGTLDPDFSQRRYHFDDMNGVVASAKIDGSLVLVVSSHGTFHETLPTQRVLWIPIN